jgi:hypothetical protein
MYSANSISQSERTNATIATTVRGTRPTTRFATSTRCAYFHGKRTRTMTFDDDPIVKFMRLDGFRRDLMWVKLDKLGLTHLQPLRDEIVEKMDALRDKMKK